MSSPDIDRIYMGRALELAARGLYTTRPNPRVGCVIVRYDEHPADADNAAPLSPGRIVAEAWTAPAGGLHAEARALAIAGDAARGATVYCTLEPCAHFGRTPPCADALIRARPARVVVATGDPFDQVDGAGLAKLRAAGIEVETGLLAAEARALNPGFHRRHEGGRPWVRLKIAASLDGRTAMASGESRWITGPEARRDVQHLRARSCAIVTGVGTVLADDPRMTLRAEALDDLPPFDLAFLARRPPLRVVLDSALRTPPNALILGACAGAGSGSGTGIGSDTRRESSNDERIHRGEAADSAAGDALIFTAAGADAEDSGRRARRDALAARARIVEVAASSTSTSTSTSASSASATSAFATSAFAASAYAAAGGGQEPDAGGSAQPRPALAAVLDALAAEHCNEVLFECGPVLAGAALQAGLVDELWLYQAPVLLGASARPLAQVVLQTMAERLRFSVRDTARIGDDMRWVLIPDEAPAA